MVDLQGLGEQVSAKANVKAQHRLWYTMDVSELRLSVIAMSTVTVAGKSPDKGLWETARLRISCLVEVLQAQRAR